MACRSIWSNRASASRSCKSHAQWYRAVSTTATLEALFKRDRLLVVAALFCVITFSWGYILAGAGSGMTALEATAMSRPVGLSDGAAANVRVIQAAAWGTGYERCMASVDRIDEKNSERANTGGQAIGSPLLRGLPNRGPYTPSVDPIHLVGTHPRVTVS